MGSEELNNALYEKMSAEQCVYREWLLSLPAQEILDHAYEYSIREDILIAMEEDILSEEQAQALLQSLCPLADVYKAWQKRDNGSHMGEIEETIVECAPA
jgi:hypothetical protein